MEIDPRDLKISEKEFHKIIFIYNALQDGWTIKKRGENKKLQMLVIKWKKVIK